MRALFFAAVVISLGLIFTPWAMSDTVDATATLDLSNFDGLPVWVQAILGIIVLAKVITALTPTQVDNDVVKTWLNPILLFVNRWLALNIGGNANADDPGAAEVVDATAEKKAAAYVAATKEATSGNTETGV